MVWAARPGSKPMIADETSDDIHSEYKKNTFARKYFADDKFYCITFRKVASKGKAGTAKSRRTKR